MRRRRFEGDLVPVSAAVEGLLSDDGPASTTRLSSSSLSVTSQRGDRHDSATDHRLPTVELLSSERFAADPRSASSLVVDLLSSEQLPRTEAIVWNTSSSISRDKNSAGHRVSCSP